MRIQKILSRSNFSIEINDFSLKVSPELEQEIEIVWQKEQKKNENLFNGLIVSATTVSPQIIQGFVCEYRYLIAQRIKPELFDVLQIRPVAVSGLLLCTDGIVVGRRGKEVSQNSGFWELVPSGGIDATNIKFNAKVSPVSQIFTELQEEIGVKPNSVLHAKPFCLVEDINSHVIDIGIVLKTSLTKGEVEQHYYNSPSKEYEELCVLNLSELDAFIIRHQKNIVDVSQALFQAFEARDVR